ncbi:hypothetical protein ACHQM5_017138 [Ranunculus cassubicifolius]
MLAKKLLSTISVLRSRAYFPSVIFSNTKISRVFSYSSCHLREFTGFANYQDHLLTNLRFSQNNFCSKSNAGVNECWNCNKVAASKPFLACESCRCVQPVDASVDYFQIFDLDKIYGIDDTHLESKYKNWQKKLHPDLVHTKSEKEKEYAAEQSARVIDAYQTLQKPLLRATYLLRLEGVQVDEEKTVSEPELLMEMMEFREAVEDAGNPQTLKQVQEKMDTWCQSFKKAFEKKKFGDAILAIQRMTYYHKINEEIVKKL